MWVKIPSPYVRCNFQRSLKIGEALTVIVQPSKPSHKAKHEQTHTHTLSHTHIEFLIEHFIEARWGTLPVYLRGLRLGVSIILEHCI